MAIRNIQFLVAPACLFLWCVAGAESNDPYESVPLPDHEREQITKDLLAVYPELASSPGIKSAYAPRERPANSELWMKVIFYPHSDQRGIKEAFQANCTWIHANESWVCDDVTIRKYLRLPTQDYEVRLSADLSHDAALALIEGSRRDLKTAAGDTSNLPDTAVIIMPHVDTNGEPLGSYSISWGTPKGQPRLRMIAQLEDDGDPTNPDDWHASLFER